MKWLKALINNWRDKIDPIAPSDHWIPFEVDSCYKSPCHEGFTKLVFSTAPRLSRLDSVFYNTLYSNGVYNASLYVSNLNSKLDADRSRKFLLHLFEETFLHQREIQSRMSKGEEDRRLYSDVGNRMALAVIEYIQTSLKDLVNQKSVESNRQNTSIKRMKYHGNITEFTEWASIPIELDKFQEGSKDDQFEFLANLFGFDIDNGSRIYNQRFNKILSRKKCTFPIIDNYIKTIESQYDIGIKTDIIKGKLV